MNEGAYEPTLLKGDTTHYYQGLIYQHVREIMRTQIVEEAPREEEVSALGMDILSMMLSTLEPVFILHGWPLP